MTGVHLGYRSEGFNVHRAECPKDATSVGDDENDEINPAHIQCGLCDGGARCRTSIGANAIEPSVLAHAPVKSAIAYRDNRLGKRAGGGRCFGLLRQGLALWYQHAIPPLFRPLA